MILFLKETVLFAGFLVLVSIGTFCLAAGAYQGYSAYQCHKYALNTGQPAKWSVFGTCYVKKGPEWYCMDYNPPKTPSKEAK